MLVFEQLLPLESQSKHKYGFDGLHRYCGVSGNVSLEVARALRGEVVGRAVAVTSRTIT